MAAVAAVVRVDSMAAVVTMAWLLLRPITASETIKNRNHLKSIYDLFAFEKRPSVCMCIAYVLLTCPHVLSSMHAMQL